MGKERSTFFCRECGYESVRWIGKCPGCEAWHSFVEERTAAKSPVVTPSGPTIFRGLQGSAARRPDTRRLAGGRTGSAEAATLLSSVLPSDQVRLDTGSAELNRVLGGGIVPGSLVLLSGEPGIGKSTFLLQLAQHMGQSTKVLYVSGEESIRQLRLRADRLGLTEAQVHVMTEVSLNMVGQEALGGGYEIIIVDSIQTMMLEELQSAPGSVSQVREGAAFLMRLAKEHNIAVFLVGHVTKEGTIAGPRVLEHMVDTVLYFEGDQYHIFRLLRAVKNRFGPSNEIGVFEMRGNGLIEVRDPSRVFLGEWKPAAGTAVTVTMEGTRPILVEIQALVSPAVNVPPRRTVNGLDYNRLLILLAVLDKRIGLRFAAKDVFLNIAGGMKIFEPAVDLAVAGALLSAIQDRILPPIVMLGEIGLTGEIRGIAQVEQRVREAEDFGFEGCLLPEANWARLTQLGEAEQPKGTLYPVKTIEEVIALLFS